MTNDEICQHGDQSATQGGTHPWTSEIIDKVSGLVVENFRNLYAILLHSAVLSDDQVLCVEQMLSAISAAIMHRIQHFSSPDTRSDSHNHPTFMAQCQALLESIETENGHERHKLIKLFLDWNIPVLVATAKELAQHVDSKLFLVRLEHFFGSAMMFLNEKGEGQLSFQLFDNGQTVSDLSKSIIDLKKLLLDVAATSETHAEHGLTLNQIFHLLFKMIAYALVSQYLASVTLPRHVFFNLLMQRKRGIC